jgi:hypothetical protein
MHRDANQRQRALRTGLVVTTASFLAFLVFFVLWQLSLGTAPGVLVLTVVILVLLSAFSLWLAVKLLQSLWK